MTTWVIIESTNVVSQVLGVGDGADISAFQAQLTQAGQGQTVMDVTEITPPVQTGATWNGGTSFTEPPPPPTAAQLQAQELISYAQGKAASVLGNPQSFSIGAANPVVADGTAETLTTLFAYNGLLTAKPSQSVNWVDFQGNVTALTAAQVSALLTAVATYVSDVNDQLAAICNGVVAATPTITNNAQIDAIVWPTS